MSNIDFLNEELHEIIEGQSFQDDNEEYDLFLFETKDKKYIVYFNLMDLTTGESRFSVMKEFEDVEMARKEFDFYRVTEEKES